MSAAMEVKERGKSNMNSSSRVRIPTSKQEIHRVCHSVTVPLISHENVQTASVPRTINCA